MKENFPRVPMSCLGLLLQADEKQKREKFVLSVAFSPDGKRLACGVMDGTVVVFDVPSSKLMHTLTGHHKPVRDVCFTPGQGHIMFLTLCACSPCDGFRDKHSSLRLSHWVLQDRAGMSAPCHHFHTGIIPVTRKSVLVCMKCAKRYGTGSMGDDRLCCADSRMLLTACDDMHAHLYDVEHATLIEAFSGARIPPIAPKV